MARVAVRFGLGTIVATGIIAGIIFAAFEMFAAALLMGPEGAAMPLRMIGAMVLGSTALDPGYSLAVAAMTGVVVHMVLSIAFAGVFAVIASFVAVTTAGEVLTTARSLALAGIVFGIALWLVNFYGVAPLAGWTWFPERTDPVVQFLAHALFFGCPVGWMLGRPQPQIGPTV
jgi:hypothetical protein